jgi:biotin carboxylase
MVPDGAALLVERFVGGGEVAVEGLLDDGRLHVLAVFDKPDPPQGPTFPETVLVTPSRLAADLQHRLHRDTAAVCAALGLRHGPVHAEFRIAPDGTPHFLEIAARTIGGRCASMLPFPDGATLEELVLRQALGMAFDGRRVGGAVGVHMLAVPRSGRVVAIDGVEEARRLDGIAEVAIEVSIGEPVEALPFGGRYAGFVFARAATPEAVVATLAKASVRVEVQP